MLIRRLINIRPKFTVRNYHRDLIGHKMFVAKLVNPMLSQMETGELQTLLKYNVYENNFHLVETLLVSNGKFTVDQQLIMTAIKTGNHKLVSLLIKYGFDINSLNDKGQTILMLACVDTAHSVIDESMIKTLIDLGADVNIQDATGKTALMYTIIKPSKNFSIGQIKELIKTMDIDFDLEDNTGKNAMYYAHTSLNYYTLLNFCGLVDSAKLDTKIKKSTLIE